MYGMIWLRGMDTEANKILVKRYLELWGTSNPRLTQEILAANFVDHTHPQKEESHATKSS